MTKDRLQLLLGGRRPDRMPFFPFARGFCSRTVGYTIGSLYSDPKKSFWAQLWTREMYDHDETLKSSGEWEQSISVIRYPVQSEEDVEKLKLPEVKTAGIVPLAMEFSRLQRQHGLTVTALVGSPFSIAGNVCGLERLARWLIKKPQLAHRLLRLATDFGIELARYWVATFGTDNVEIRDGMPSDSNKMISPRNFQEFALPYLKELHEKVLSMGVKYIYTHVCGEQNANLPYLAQVPFGNPGIVGFGHEVDTADAIRYFGESCIIVGNVQPIVIQNGTPQQVYELARQAIEKGKKAPRGFILGTGCELPPMSPPYNVYMMRKATEDFGWYA